MSLLKIDEKFTKTYKICKKYKVPPIFIKEYKGEIINLVEFLKPKIEDMEFLKKFLDSFKLTIEKKVIFLYLLYKDDYDVKKIQKKFVEFFNYSNQKKLNSIEKYIIDLKYNIDNL